MGFEDNPFPIHIFEVGGVFFFTLINQKQATHGTQFMGFLILPSTSSHHPQTENN
jgi:hypothetical protein